MKKTFIIASVACVFLSSCTLPQNGNFNTQTANTQNANVTDLHIKTVNTQNIEISPLLADLVISEEKITHEYIHNTKGDINNAKDCAVHDALRKYGNADVLVAPQFDIELKNGVERIIVSGYPAKYKNFRNDKIQKN
jgi:hypothetical protein